MIKFILCVSFISISYFLNAQAIEDKVEYAKKSQSCLVMNYAYPAEAVENAIISKMNKLGYKGKEEKGILNKDKGFRTYNGALIDEISSSRYDYILKVERKSRKESVAALVYFLIQKDGADILTKLSSDELGKAKSFLNNLMPEIEAANLELQINAQDEAVSKAEKKLKNLQNDKEDMEKRVKKLQDDLKQNETDRANQQKEIENQKKLLEDLRLKRKN